MKKLFPQRLLAFAAAAITCAAILVTTPSPDSPGSGNTGKKSNIEMPETGKDEKQPGAEVQNDKEPDLDNGGKKK